MDSLVKASRGGPLIHTAFRVKRVLSCILSRVIPGEKGRHNAVLSLVQLHGTVSIQSPAALSGFRGESASKHVVCVFFR